MSLNYEVYKLAEVATVNAGNSAPQDEKYFCEGIYNFFRTSDIGRIKVGEITTSLEKLNEEGVKGLKLFKTGTILFPKSGASTFLNHRVMIATDGYVSSHLATIKANNQRLLDKYLFYYLTTVDARDLVQDSNYPSLKTSAIGNIELSLPPIVVQKQIVEKLDSAFAEIDKAISVAQQNAENAKALFQSHLNDVFENSGKDWKVKTINEIGELIDSLHKTPSYVDSGYAMVRVTDIKPGELCLAKTRKVDETTFKEFSKRHTPHVGDIVFSRVGSYGVSALVSTDEEFCLGQNTVFIIPKVNSVFLYYFLNSPFAKKQFDRLVDGVTQPTISLRSIKQVEVPVPDNDRQEELAEVFKLFSQYSISLSGMYLRKCELLQELKKSILTQAFSGDLTKA